MPAGEHIARSYGVSETAGGCIDRCRIVFFPTRSGLFHRPQSAAGDSVVHLMALEWLLRTGKRPRSRRMSNRHGAVGNPFEPTSTSSADAAWRFTPARRIFAPLRAVANEVAAGYFVQVGCDRPPLRLSNRMTQKPP